MSLRWRLMVILALVAAGAIGLASIGAYVSTRDELRSEIDAFLIRRADELVQGQRSQPGSRGDGGAPRVAQTGQDSGQGQNGQDGDGGGGNGGGGDGGSGGSGLPFEPDAVSQTVDAQGEVTGSSSLAVVLPVDEADLALATGTEPDARLRDVTVDGVDYRQITVNQPDAGALQVARPLTETNDVLGALTQRLGLIAAAGAVVAGLIGWLVARRTTEPLRRLTGAAEEVAATQDLSTPIAVDRSDEVGSLAESFNTMLDALDTSRRQQHQLVLDAGHELRTPLTSLRTGIELLQRGGTIPADERQRLLDRAQVELVELTHLVTEVVELATDTRTSDEPEQDVALGDLVDDVCETTRQRTGRVITVTMGGSPPGVVWGRPGLLERAVRNLLGNAHKFSPPEGAIDVVVAGGTVMVRDEGPGIPEAERETVFSRFHRSDAARGMPGSGLGLSIVRQIVEDHGGRVWAAEAPGGGAEVGFELPTR